MVPDHDSESFRQVDITAALAERPAPARDDAAVLLALAQTTAARPDHALQALADCALHSTGAHSSGISITDVDAGEDVFHWVATAGRFASQVHGTMPRWFSPCGDVLRTDRLLLLRRPAQHYTYLGDFDTPIVEALLSPIRRNGRPVGTVWALLHDESSRFDTEDARLLATLTQFTSDTADLLERLSFGVTL
jgi:hypothetical protein